jgi:hypothetical protein
MKNQSTNKSPQVTCSGDVMGGSTVRGKAWGLLFLRRDAMKDGNKTYEAIIQKRKEDQKREQDRQKL